MSGMKRRAVWALALFWAALLVCSVCLGRYEIAPREVAHILLGGPADPTAAALLFSIRLPRLALVAFSGGALAVAGLVYQTVFSNPLASPDVLGVASGASVGAAAAMLLFPGAFLLRQGMAFGCGLAAVAAALYLARFVRHNRVLGLVLAGIVVGGVSEALLMMLKFCADPQRQLPAIEYWLMGGFQNARWRDAAAVAVFMLAAGGLLHLLRFPMKALSLGDERAWGLGISPQRLRLGAVACATVLVAAVVSVAGVVSWVGLIAPHMARLLGARDIVKSMPAVFFMGSALLLLADLLARTLSAAEIPVSIFTSFFGASALGIFLVCGALRRKGDAL